MKRKIVQIAAHRAGDNDDVDTITALADDGSLWEGYKTATLVRPAEYNDKGALSRAAGYEYPFTWHRLPDLPGDVSNLTKVR